MLSSVNPIAGLVRGLSLAAAAVLMLAASPGRPAQAMSLITPSAAPSARNVSDDLMTQVHGGHGGGGFHGGGGGGFHGGGFHGGGWHGGGFHGGGFHGGGWHGGGAAFHGGGFRYGGYGFAHHGFHRHFFGGGYGYPYYYGDDYPYYFYPFHHCRIVWTYYGPHRVCGWHGWHHWHHRHFWHHRRHW